MHTHTHTPLTHKHTYILLLFSRPVVSDSLRPRGLLHANNAAAKSLQSCPTLCDPVDGSPPGSPIPGILQA